MKVVMALDSFKGSLSSKKACDILEAAFADAAPHIHVEKIPMADGGEGIQECLLEVTGGQEFPLSVASAVFDPITTTYGVLGDGATAIIEVARIVGLTELPTPAPGILTRSSYGIGEALIRVLDAGFRNIVLGLGGSSTTDGGLGMLQALGIRFLDKDGVSLPPTAASLANVHAVDASFLDKRVLECTLFAATDVNNPLYGPQGAAKVFGPQKGAAPEEIEFLDKGLESYAAKLEAALGEEWRNAPGSGAAGGLGYAVMAIGGQVVSGASFVADKVGLRKTLQNADYVITGEGKTDIQTLSGKVPWLVANLAAEQGVEVVLVSGSIDNTPALDRYFTRHYSLVSETVSVEEAIGLADQLLYRTGKEVALQLGRE